MVQFEIYFSQAQNHKPVSWRQLEGLLIVAQPSIGLSFELVHISQVIAPAKRFLIQRDCVCVTGERGIVETICLVDLSELSKERGGACSRTVMCPEGGSQIVLRSSNLLLDGSIYLGDIWLRNFDQPS